MKKTLKSREAILSAGKESIAQSGAQALSIRDIAHRCGIAVGSVYNYFPSKEDLIIATVESIWIEIMPDARGCNEKSDFIESLRFLFESIKEGTEKYPAFFSIHSVSFAHMDKNKGREVMNQYFGYMKNGLLEALAQDTKVSENIFSGTFTKSAFVDFVFSNFLMLLVNEEVSCDYLLELVKRVIYK